MMKKTLSLMFVLCAAATMTACIEDGPLPAGDNPDAGAPPADATPVQPDAQVPAPTLTFWANPDTITLGQSSTLNWTTTNAVSCQIGGAVNQRPNGSLTITPTMTMNFQATCKGPGGQVVKYTTVTVNAPTPVVCHGLYVTFTATAESDIDHCTGWHADGTGTSLPISLQVNGGDGVCAITCASKTCDGQNVLPEHVSGVWQPGATADVPRWTTPGCKRLPDHPASEPDQAGGTWDGRCDKF